MKVVSNIPTFRLPAASVGRTVPVQIQPPYFLLPNVQASDLTARVLGTWSFR